MVAAGTLFEPTLPGRVLLQLACRLSRFGSLNPLQSSLLVGQALTLVLAVISCRWAGFGPSAALLGGFLMATAPCALSRIGHLGLSVLIPVIPALLSCLQLQRCLLGPGQRRWIPLWGAVAGLLTFPAQDYYIAFGLLLLLATLLLLLLLATTRTLELAPLADLLWRGSLFVAGLVAVVLVLVSPKLLAAGLPGPPPAWAALRAPIEQFRYGLLPFTWLIAPPWVASTREALQQAGINTASESYFWSSGSLLIPISWVFAVRRLAQAPQRNEGDRRFYALLLLLTSALGLLCMTMGGLGTLFAVWVSPVLRSLNRFSVFVYGAAVLYLLAEFDLWCKRRELNP